MTHLATPIPCRLSTAELSVLWPGLDLIIRLHVAWNIKSGIRYE